MQPIINHATVYIFYVDFSAVTLLVLILLQGCNVRSSPIKTA